MHRVRQAGRDLAIGGRAVRSQHRRAPRPTATSRPVTPRRAGGRPRATSIDGITLSKGRKSGRTRAEPPFCSQAPVWRGGGRGAPGKVGFAPPPPPPPPTAAAPAL